MAIATGSAAMPAGWRHRARWLLLAVLAVVAVVYWPGLRGGFVFDDYPNIIDNTALHIVSGAGWSEWIAAIFSSPASSLRRPLAMLTFAANHALTGLNPYWMKLTNLGIHLVNTVLVFGLGRLLLQVASTGGQARGAANIDRDALWIAAAWALNPINLMAVLLVVQRMESLCHTFVLAGLWLYMAGRMRMQATGHGWALVLAGILGGTVLGVLVKESAVLLPLYALVLEWALLGFSSHGRRRDRRLGIMFALLLVMPAVIGLAWLLPRALHPGAYDGRGFTLVERLLTESRVLVDYLHWTLLPNLSELSLYHDDYPVSHALLSPPGTLWALLLLGALAGTALWLHSRRPLIAVGLAWFFCAHLLTATVVPLELVFEHRNYFASLGLCLALADLLLRLPQTMARRRIGAAVAVALLLLYSGLTALRANEWRNPLLFSLTEAAKHPQSPRATYDVARNFVILSEYRADSPHVPRAMDALEHAMAVPGATPLPESAAITLAARTDIPIRGTWWDQMQGKLRTQPIGPQQTGSLNTLVACSLREDCPLPKQEMVATFFAALERGPNAEVISIYGNYVLNELEQPEAALLLWRQAASMKPRTLEYRTSVIKLLIAMSQFDEAQELIHELEHIGSFGDSKARASGLQLRLNSAKDKRDTITIGQEVDTGAESLR